MTGITRRQLLQSAAIGAVALGGAPFATAIEPVARTAGPKFKFSLAAYSYRELLTGEKPALTLVDFIDDCAKFGLDGTELTSYYFPKTPTPEFLHGLKAAAFRRGLDVSGTAVGNDFCHAAGKTRDEQIAHVKRWIDYADALDAPVIRIFSGSVKQGQTTEQAHALAVEAIEACCAYAGEHGVYLALENHGGLTETGDGLLALVRDVKSPWFGVNLDTGNFHSASLYDDLAQLAPYAVNVQVKVVVSYDGKKEPTDYKRLATMLRESGYRGYIVLEYEEPGSPREECPKALDQLRRAFA